MSTNAALLIHRQHQNSQNKPACDTSRVCSMFVRAFLFILFFHGGLKCVSPPPSLPASRLWCPTQGETKSSSSHLIAQLQHDSWNSLQSHAALSVSMSCFCRLPPPLPPLLQLPSPSNHPSVKEEGQWPGWQRLKERWMQGNVVCACAGRGKVAWWRRPHLIAAQIHFLILELFLDLSGVSAGCWAHGQSGSQSGRGIGFPSL